MFKSTWFAEYRIRETSELLLNQVQILRYVWESFWAQNKNTEKQTWADDRKVSPFFLFVFCKQFWWLERALVVLSLTPIPESDNPYGYIFWLFAEL